MSDWKKLVTLVAGVVVALAIALFVGRVWGGMSTEPALNEARSRAASAERELGEARASHSTALADLESRLAATSRRAALLDARRDIAVALDEVDQRNFGLARAACQRAAATLRAEGAELPAVAELADALDGFTFELGGDFEDSRRRLRGHAEALDRVLSPDAEAAPSGA